MQESVHEFAKDVEDTISTVEDKLFADIPAEQKRFFAIKLLERDNKIAEQLIKYTGCFTGNRSIREKIR